MVIGSGRFNGHRQVGWVDDGKLHERWLSVSWTNQVKVDGIVVRRTYVVKEKSTINAVYSVKQAG